LLLLLILSSVLFEDLSLSVVSFCSFLNKLLSKGVNVESIQKYANLLRNDLELSPINDKNDFLDQRVINHYGSLIPI
jgi:hypothetical protein